MWGWDRCPRPHSVHSTHVRSTVRVGKGEHWTRTGLVSGVHPGTLERHTTTAAEYSPVHWCAFRVRVRCLEQAAVGFLDCFCSNDSNRHIYITSQHTAHFQTTPALRPARAGLTAQSGVTAENCEAACASTSMRSWPVGWVVAAQQAVTA